MRRSTVRFFAFIVLALLGAPLAMHVVLHDLHDHHDDRAATTAFAGQTGHGDHEHPIVSSAAPQVPCLTRVALPVAMESVATPATSRRIASAERNVVSVGALRTDDDVGLQALLATFLI